MAATGASVVAMRALSDSLANVEISFVRAVIAGTERRG